jgi:hypothetical protein
MIMIKTIEQTSIIESSDITELEEIFAQKTGQPIPQKIVVPKVEKSIQQQTQPKQEPIIPKEPPVVTIQKIPEPPKEIPVEVQAQPSPIQPPQVKNSLSFSFDSVLERGIQKQFETIDANAALQKEQYINNVSDKLLKFLEGTTSTTLQQPAPPIIQQPVPVEPVIVKDNSEAIKMLKEEIRSIDIQIIDPKAKDILSLQAEKMILKKQIAKLEGTYVEPTEAELPPEGQRGYLPNGYPKSDPKPKGHISIKLLLAAFGGTATIVTLLWLTLSLLGKI